MIETEDFVGHSAHRVPLAAAVTASVAGRLVGKYSFVDLDNSKSLEDCYNSSSLVLCCRNS